MMASSCRWIINMRALKRHLLTIYPVQFNPIHIGVQGLAFHKGNGGILQRYFQLKGFNDSKMLLASLKLRGKCSNKKALVSQGALAQNTYSRNTHKQWKKQQDPWKKRPVDLWRKWHSLAIGISSTMAVEKKAPFSRCHGRFRVETNLDDSWPSQNLSTQNGPLAISAILGEGVFWMS